MSYQQQGKRSYYLASTLSDAASRVTSCGASAISSSCARLACRAFGANGRNLKAKIRRLGSWRPVVVSNSE